MKETFARMAMNDEETVVDRGRPYIRQGAWQWRRLDAGGRARGRRSRCPWLWLGQRRGAGGIGEHAVTSGIEGADQHPDKWTDNYFRLCSTMIGELVCCSAGANQWQPIGQKEEDMAPAAWIRNIKVPTMMTTADMALKRDPAYRKISESFAATMRRSRMLSRAHGSS